MFRGEEVDEVGCAEEGGDAEECEDGGCGGEEGGEVGRDADEWEDEEYKSVLFVSLVVLAVEGLD